MSERPFVSVLMPCLNEEAFIESCVASVLDQTYPPSRMEILIADGGSTDRTRALIEAISARDSRVKLVDNPGKIQAAGLNAAIRASRGEVLARMDVHAEYAPDFLEKSVDALERTGADNAGGAARARAKGLFQRALCAALQSPLGVGGSKYRSEDNEGFVESVFNGAFRRRVFEDIGMYDPRAVTNEDAELNQRIITAGGKIYLSKEIVQYYYPRESFSSLAKQYFKYGKGRARTLLKHGKFLSVRPAVPFFLVVGGASLLLTSHLQPLTPLSFAAYALVTGAEAVRVTRGAPLRETVTAWAIFPVLHVAHGTGFAVGLAHYALHPDWAPAEKLAKEPGVDTVNGARGGGSPVVPSPA
jgi:succinoglycan biosynthesis protein ExoA